MRLVEDFRAILGDRVWEDGFGETRLVLTYGFAESLPDHQANQQTAAFRQSFAALDGAARDTARNAVGQWDDASALTFVEVAADDADIVFGSYDFSVSADKTGVAGFAFFPNTSRLAGDVFIDQNATGDLALYLHEIGHALGLEHPFEGDFILPPTLDNRATTVMSSTGFGTGSLAAFDIAAIQAMYGPPEQSPPPVIPDIGYANAFVSQATSPFSLSAGQTRDVSFRISNVGEDPFGGPVVGEVVLSTDRVLDGDDIRIGSAVFGDLAAETGVQTMSVSVTVPADIFTGDYVLGYVADARNDVAETNETDNVFFLDRIFSIAGREPEPDPEAPEDETPEDEDQVIGGGDEAEALSGGAGDDTVDGGGGDDTIDGGAGDDRIFGGAGADVLRGQSGDDRISGNGGRDDIRGSGGADRLFGGAGGDRVEGRGGVDRILGGAGGDSVFGNGGQDLVRGDAGDDRVAGGRGADKLLGGAGDDTLIGGLGADTLNGGEGADVFIFQRFSGEDRINGFEQGLDRIDIDTVTSLSDVILTQEDGDVRITHLRGEILVKQQRVEDFDVADFGLTAAAASEADWTSPSARTEDGSLF